MKKISMHVNHNRDVIVRCIYGLQQGYVCTRSHKKGWYVCSASLQDVTKLNEK